MKPVRARKLRQLLLRKLGEEAGVFAAKLEGLKTGERCSLAENEGAQATQDMAVRARLAQMHSDVTRGLRNALNRLEAGTYGTCTDCGCGIEVARLDAMPFASRCRNCQEEAEGTVYDKTKKFPMRILAPDMECP